MAMVSHSGIECQECLTPVMNRLHNGLLWWRRSRPYPGRNGRRLASTSVFALSPGRTRGGQTSGRPTRPGVAPGRARLGARPACRWPAPLTNGGQFVVQPAGLGDRVGRAASQRPAQVLGDDGGRLEGEQRKPCRKSIVSVGRVCLAPERRRDGASDAPTRAGRWAVRRAPALRQFRVPQDVGKHYGA